MPLTERPKTPTTATRKWYDFAIWHLTFYICRPRRSRFLSKSVMVTAAGWSPGQPACASQGLFPGCFCNGHLGQGPHGCCFMRVVPSVLLSWLSIDLPWYNQHYWATCMCLGCSWSRHCLSPCLSFCEKGKHKESLAKTKKSIWWKLYALSFEIINMSSGFLCTPKSSCTWFLNRYTMVRLCLSIRKQ